jgi:glycosyltransferase involved in cell wall biosynthesis
MSDTKNSFLQKITPIILTFNEEANIGRSLERLTAFSEVLVVDSGSTDRTLEIVASFPNTRVVSREFDSFSGQWNYAIRACGVDTEWVMAMDADYMVSDALVAELSCLDPVEGTAAYRISFDYAVYGRKLAGTLYPPIIALYRHRQVSYIQDGHCMRATVAGGEVKELNGKILHDDRKPLSRWLVSQARYADEESDLLISKLPTELKLQDRLRKAMVITPWLVPLYCLTVKKGLLDGRAGWYYAFQRGVAEAILALRLCEKRFFDSEK